MEVGATGAALDRVQRVAGAEHVTGQDPATIRHRNMAVSHAMEREPKTGAANGSRVQVTIFYFIFFH